MAAEGAPVRMRRRCLIAVLLVILVGFGGVSVRLGKLQLVEGEELQKQAINQQMRDTTINATRGTIYDSNMEVMAQSATVWNVFISPISLVVKGNEASTEKKRALVADGLSEILGVDRDEIYQKTLKSKSYQVYIKKKVEMDVRTKILEFKKNNSSVAAAIGLEEDTKRYYPNAELAASVLGFTGTDGQGLAGVESYYDSYLQGVSGRVMTIKNANGTEMDFDYEQRVDAQDGDSVVLSIDKNIQSYLEKYLDQAIQDNAVGNRIVGIVMNVNTFEVLGMATRNAFDPNHPFAIADESKAAEIAALPEEEQAAAISAAQSLQWRNKAISDPYEPGSVFKAFTASAALDEGVVSLTSTFTCTGNTVLGGVRYQCNNGHVHGTQNIVQAMENSCNLAFMQIGQALGIPAFTRYYESFGFTAKTGIDLPGEAAPIAGVHYHVPSAMGITELASSSFGQSRKMTPIQMITAMCSVVNGGYLGTPHVVKQILSADGNIVETKDAGIKRQVISEATSATMRTGLEMVVKEGGGKNAAVDGYRVGGKTGTAEKLDTEDKTARIASFCGFAPVDDPEIACIIVVDEPRGSTIYGSTVAAPIFKSVMTDVLPYLGIEKTENVENSDTAKQSTVPKVIGETVAQAQSAVKAQGLGVRVLGSGETVIAQLPDPETRLSAGGTVVLYTDEDSRNELVVVPNFAGMTAEQANRAASKSNLNLRLTGDAIKANAIVTEQSIQEQSQVSQGTIVTLKFSAANQNE